MNPQTADEALRLFYETEKLFRKTHGVTVVVCPPFVWLPFLGGKWKFENKNTERRKKSNFQLGAQDVFWELQGAYTGEISPTMLKDLGCSYVIVGHSERRWKMGEGDEMVQRKLKAALKHRLRPVLCVGERSRKEDGWELGIKEQVTAALQGVPRTRIGEVIIAYEPVWAIGTGTPDTPDNALAAAILIRKTVTQLFSKSAARDIPVLYGGSVTEKDVSAFVSQEGIDGVLVGGASLRAHEFARIVEIVVSS